MAATAAAAAAAVLSRAKHAEPLCPATVAELMGEQCPQHPAPPLGTAGCPAEQAGGDVSAKDGTPAAAQQPQANRRRLRILCLHGFRQSARSFEASRLSPCRLRNDHA